jgi:hypothetical protein
VLLHLLPRPAPAVRVHGNLCRLGLLPVSAPGAGCMLPARANTNEQAGCLSAGRILFHCTLASTNPCPSGSTSPWPPASMTGQPACGLRLLY